MVIVGILVTFQSKLLAVLFVQEDWILLEIIKNHGARPAPFGAYQAPAFSIICLSLELIEKGSICLLDFAKSLPIDEGPPIYVLYSPKQALPIGHVFPITKKVGFICIQKRAKL